MKKKELQMSRMWQYFVDATAEIIEQEGIEHVTIRKVADKAGYNSATIYNYFTEVSHLIFFASMKFLKSYTDELSTFIEQGSNSLEKYLLAWECFCKHSFLQPQVFHAVFVMDLGDHPERLLEEYYKTYPSDLINIPEALKPILFERNMSKRGKSFLETAIQEGLLTEDEADYINEITNLVWTGMMTDVLNNRRNYDLQEAAKKTMRYIHAIVLQTTKGVN